MGALETSRTVYDLLTTVSAASPPRLRTWTGDLWGPSDASATLVLNHPGALRAMLVPPTDLAAAEAYLYGDVDLDGDIFSLLEFAAGLEQPGPTRRQRLKLVNALRTLPSDTGPDHGQRPGIRGFTHSMRRDRAAVSYHYDTGNDFFATFLDPMMVYSCAYFIDPSEPLGKAQVRKLDLICRKLELEPGEHLLDVGCGWGALGIYAAEHFGCTVTGVTLSTEQASHAAALAQARGLGDRCDFRVQDYRQISGRFDKIASVGMFEHVGRAKLGEYFARLRRLLAPGGIVLNHGITTRDRSRRPLRARPTFVSTYVFPDGELNPVEVGVNEAEKAGFELRDLESLRQSYALTLRHWVENLESHRAAAVAATNERIYRIWRLYMAGSSVAFSRAEISVYQMVLADPARPWTFGRRRLLSPDDH